MVAIWSMLFCDACGNLLPRSTGARHEMVPCDDCGSLTKDDSATTITSKSKPGAFPSALRAKHSAVQTLNEDELNTEALAQKECPQCHRTEMFYHTQQLRSADEGSTVFYRCECGYKENTNN